jgi:hypothetical protein
MKYANFVGAFLIACCLGSDLYARAPYQHCSKRSTFLEADEWAYSESSVVLVRRVVDVNPMGVYALTRSLITLTNKNGSPEWRVCYDSPEDPIATGENNDPMCNWNIFGISVVNQIGAHIGSLKDSTRYKFDPAHLGMPLYLEGRWTNRVHSCLRFEPISGESETPPQAVCALAFAKNNFGPTIKDLERKFVSSDSYQNLPEKKKLNVSIQFEVVKSVLVPGTADWKICFIPH